MANIKIRDITGTDRTYTTTKVTFRDAVNEGEMITFTEGDGTTVSPLTVTENGTYTAEEGTAYSPVTVNVSGGGGGSSDDVRFIDYDGTVVQQYSAAEFLALTDMPDNPTHEELISQGWNWTLQNAQDYVKDYKMLDIGQMYVTHDGATRLYVHMDEGRLNPYMSFNITGTVSVDWGDDTPIDTRSVSGISGENYSHMYSIAGDYIITISPGEAGGIFITGSSVGTYLLKSQSNNANYNKTYAACIRHIMLGKGVTLYDSAFRDCANLIDISIPSTAVFDGAHLFMNCYSLKSVTIPSGVTSLKTQFLYSCYSLETVCIPKEATGTIYNAFTGCQSLCKVAIPKGKTDIEELAFNGCHALKCIMIPDGVTTIGTNAFTASIIKEITLPETLTYIGSNSFNGCYALQSVKIPNSVTSAGTQVFASNYGLKTAIISNQLQTIPAGLFTNCKSLSNITIPQSVTSIAANAFSSCFGLGFVRFESSLPPTVAASSAWNNLPTDCVIYVPSGSLSAYTSATNYPSSSTYTYVEY